MTKTPGQVDADVDDERMPCTVCGRGVLYGSRHHNCGTAILKAEAEARAAMVEQIAADANLLLSERQRFAIRAIAAMPPTHVCVEYKPIAWAYKWPNSGDFEIHKSRLSEGSIQVRKEQGVIEYALVAASKGEA